MTAHISPSDLKLLDAEPRVLDLRLAEALAFEDRHKIRDLIKRNLGELGRHGAVSATVAETSPQGGRPGNEYWLNEAQSLLICMFSRTERAADVRAQVITVFMAWRHQQPARDAATQIAVPFPETEGPLQVHALKLATIKECRLVHGPLAAARLWRRIGLPAVDNSLVYDADDGRACLRHLLSATVGPDAWFARTAIGAALDGFSQANDWLDAIGVRAVMEPDGIVVANAAGALMRIFDRTAWDDGKFIAALRRLPGAQPRRARIGGSQVRGTFVPAELIDISEIDAPDPVTPSPNSPKVVQLRPVDTH